MFGHGLVDFTGLWVWSWEVQWTGFSGIRCLALRNRRLTGWQAAVHRLRPLFPLSDTLLASIEESFLRLETPRSHNFDHSDQFVSLLNPCVCSLPLGPLCWRIRLNRHHRSSTAKALGAEVTYRKPETSTLMTVSIIVAGLGMLFVATLGQ